MRAIVVGAVVIGIAACGGSDPPPVDDGCPGAVPALDDCFVGNFFADCGGDGAPRLGCSDGAECLWFSGGCVAAGYQASTCPADDVCCHGDWPFDPPDSTSHQLQDAFYSLGTQPWDATIATVLTVAVDPTLTATASVVTCDGDLGLEPRNPCSDGAHGVSFARTKDTLLAATVRTSGIVGWNALVEIIPDGSALAARLCADRYTDTFQTVCYQDDPRVRTCAVSGSVQISAWPTTPADLTTMVLTFDATFANGTHMTGALVPPAT